MGCLCSLFRGTNENSRRSRRQDQNSSLTEENSANNDIVIYDADAAYIPSLENEGNKYTHSFIFMYIVYLTLFKMMIIKKNSDYL